MSTATLTRAWTDLEFRAELSTAELEKLSHPSGDIDAELGELYIQEATHETTDCTNFSAVNAEMCCC